ncbi:DUF3375 domain-containing protein [Microbacterium sp. M3]|uniref:DUF3375 domain-containing protein n=1 Tax=Microbacterium arthrosphaerae TaxID=792652 RepID=A0ABU4GYQ3_9MICO|nr:MULTISPECIES: DUF3375 domain-containing protein [Microbacterium]MDW4572211.1 DUF3375 domain-containing protein [Microbacterium arthrosphaerae]MDW7606066.1 DUF3375 domain-containing protein [Microbacterium sp. M3]
MGNTRAEAAYLRALAAFKTPTLDLLHGRYAPFVVAVLSVVFTPDRPTVAVSDAHAEVAEILDELRAAGYEGDDRPLPTGTAREICRYWVRVGWLAPQIDGDTEVYRLTAHAVGALEITGRTGGGRTRVSNSRVRTLLEAVERLAGSAETDPARRLARLIEERDALDAEIVRLEHGDQPPVDDEELLEEAENILHLSRELPADFTRVAESIKAMQRDVVADLRRDVRPTGEVLREYLERGQHVMQSTPEGRAFAGALRLIGDPERIDDLTEQLHSLVSRPFAQLMDAQQRDELDAIGRRVELGVQEVLTAQRRASHVITGQVRTHDPIRDRQVDDLLRDVMSGLQAWTQGAARDAPVEPVRDLPAADIGHLRQSVSDIRPPGAPAPLTDADDEAEFMDADTRAWGGPRYAELEAYVLGLGERFDLGAAFEGAGDDTRRPVDLLGLLEIAHRNGMSEGDDVSVVEALRPDGTTRRFAFGSVTARTAKESDDE